MYTVYLKGNYAPEGKNWHVGKLVSQSSFGVTIEDSRGERHTYPGNSIERLTSRPGW